MKLLSKNFMVIFLILWYKDQTVYLIQYPECKLSVSYGLIQDRYEDKRYDFQHICSTRFGSSGSPILI